MTAKALPPPNQTESLRERLIREGKIVPAKNESEIFNNINDEIKYYLDLYEVKVECVKNLRREYVQLINRVHRLAEMFLEEANSVDNSESERKNKNLVVAYLRILSLTSLKSIDRLVFILFKNLSEQVAILRSGFFFAFKENMKNTP
ncbi:UNVERIFIED_ORG: hypothetical protein HNP28_001026 [Comamonas terrigena]